MIYVVWVTFSSGVSGIDSVWLEQEDAVERADVVMSANGELLRVIDVRAQLPGVVHIPEGRSVYNYQSRYMNNGLRSMPLAC